MTSAHSRRSNSECQVLMCVDACFKRQVLAMLQPGKSSPGHSGVSPSEFPNTQFSSGALARGGVFSCAHWKQKDLSQCHSCQVVCVLKCLNTPSVCVWGGALSVLRIYLEHAQWISNAALVFSATGVTVLSCWLSISIKLLLCDPRNELIMAWFCQSVSFRHCCCGHWRRLSSWGVKDWPLPFPTEAASDTPHKSGTGLDV